MAVEDGSSKGELPDVLPRGAEIGRYVVLGLVGRGGMGDVYAAYDPELDRKVAVKLLRARPSAGHSTTEGRTRLLREAQAIAKLSHPNVIVVYDVGTFNEVVFIAMEFIEGDTVRYWLNANARDWREVLRVFIAAGHGLAAAHDAEIVHRDFKPDNVMVGRDGKVRVMDFGLARQTSAADLTPDSPEAAALAALKSSSDNRPPPPAPEPDSDAVPLVVPRSKQVHVDRSKQLVLDVEETRVLPAGGATISESPRSTLERSASSPNALETSITQTGAMLGTPAYMAPEQFASKAGDARTDQFSFCVALYESLYGERPFEGKSFMALMTSVARGVVRDAPAGSKVPSWVRRILLRGLNPAAEARFPSMKALLHALEHDPSVAHRRWAMAAASALLAGGLIFGAARSLQARHNPCESGAAKLAGIWEPGSVTSPRKSAIQSAFSATGKAYAARVFESVKQGLDSYTERWTSTYRDACEATAVRGEQSADVLDLRMSCLQGRLDSVKALTDLFTRADGSTIENASNAVAGLSDLDRCNDLSILRAVVKPPEDPTTRARVQTLAPRLARVKALSDAGHIAEAAALARPLAAEARSIGYLPTTALALRRLGEVVGSQTGEMESLTEESIWTAQSAGDDELVVDGALSQSYIVGYLAGDYKRAHLWLKLAGSTLARLRGHDLLRAWLINNEGLLAEAEGRYLDALSLEQRAAELKEKLLGAEHPDVAISLGNISNMLAKLGRVSEALEIGERGLRIRERFLGPEHPDVARELLNRSEQLILAKRFSEAEGIARRSLRVFERELGSGDPLLAASLSILGRSLLEQRKTHDAQALLERAYSIRTQAEKDPARRGETAFLLAQAMWHTRTERPKALSLAIEAKRAYAGSTDKDALAGVERWLHERDAL